MAVATAAAVAAPTADCSSSPFGDSIARVCLEHFRTLPKTGKPNAQQEWTVLAAVVLEQGASAKRNAEGCSEAGDGSAQTATEAERVGDEGTRGRQEIVRTVLEGGSVEEAKRRKENGGSRPLLRVAAMATGSKCLGHEKLDKEGLLILDSHAEVLARRAFQRYVRSWDVNNLPFLSFFLFSRPPSLSLPLSLPLSLCLSVSLSLFPSS